MKPIGMIALRWREVVKLNHVEGARKRRIDLIAGFPGGGFELVHLGVSLRRKLALGRFPVQIGARAVVERRVEINPNLNVRIAFVFRHRGRFGQAHADQHSIKHRQISVR